MDDLLVYTSCLEMAKGEELVPQWICLQDVDLDNLSPRYVNVTAKSCNWQFNADSVVVVAKSEYRPLYEIDVFHEMAHCSSVLQT